MLALIATLLIAMLVAVVVAGFGVWTDVSSVSSSVPQTGFRQGPMIRIGG